MACVALESLDMYVAEQFGCLAGLDQGLKPFTHTELEAAVHGVLLQFQSDGFSFQRCIALAGVLV